MNLLSSHIPTRNVDSYNMYLSTLESILEAPQDKGYHGVGTSKESSGASGNIESM